MNALLTLLQSKSPRTHCRRCTREEHTSDNQHRAFWHSVGLLSLVSVDFICELVEGEEDALHQSRRRPLSADLSAHYTHDLLNCAANEHFDGHGGWQRAGAWHIDALALCQQQARPQATQVDCNVDDAILSVTRSEKTPLPL